MDSFIWWLLGIELGVLLAHRMGRRWGALPAGLLLGCLVAGGATVKAWQVLEAPPGGAMLDVIGTVLWVNAFLTLLLVYVHDGSARVRSLFLGCLLVFAALSFGHYALVRSGAVPDRGLVALARCYVGQMLSLACVLVSACISYQMLANRVPAWPRWIRFYLALCGASCVGVVVLNALLFGERTDLRATIQRGIADFVLAAALLVPLAEIYLRFFSLLRVLPEQRRHLLDLVRWMPGYRAREHTEDRHLNLLRALPDLAFVVDEAGACVDALNADDAGHTPPPSSMRGRRLVEIFSEETASRLHDAVRAAIATGRLQQAAYRLDDGEPRTFAARITAYHDPLVGQNRAVIAVREDTQAHRALESAQAEARRYRDACHEVPAALFVADGSGRILLHGGADPAARALLPEEGRLPDEAAQNAFREAFAEALSTGSACRSFALRADDTETRFMLLMRHCDAGAGSQARIAGVLADISRPAADWEDLSSRERLESLGRLAAGAAHDINNFLVGIMGHASLAVRNISPVSRARLNVEQLQKASEKATEFTRKLLAYSGRDQPRLKAVDLNDLVRGAHQRFERLLPPNCGLRIQTGADVPFILGDAAQIEEEVGALVDNAAQASATRGGTIRVRTAAGSGDPLPRSSRYVGEPVSDEDLVWIEVADEGEGMPPEVLRLIFDPFFTTRSNRRGLGLAMALGVMRSLKGGIAAWSAPGVGSRFRLCFSAHRVPIAAAAPEPPPEFHGSGIALVVDDEEAVRAVAAQILEQLGFRVQTAVDGKQGIDAAVENIADLSLVLLDLTMPVMGGEETFTSLRMLKPDLRIILSSGYSEPEALRGLLDAPFVSFLQKPYTIEGLTATVARLFAEPAAGSAP